MFSRRLYALLRHDDGGVARGLRITLGRRRAGSNRPAGEQAAR